MAPSSECDVFLEKPFSVAAISAVNPRPSLTSDVDFYALALALWRRKWLLVVCGILGMAAVLAIAKVIPHRYTATAEILVDPRDLRVLDKEVTPRSVATDSGITVVESQVAVLSSNTVLKRVIDRLGLESDPEFNGKSDNIVARTILALNELISSPKPAQTELTTLQTLRQGVAVIRPERTFVIQLTVSTRDEEKSVRIADAIVAAYLEDQAQFRSSSNEGAAEAIDAGLDGMKKKVNDAEEKIAAYKADHSLGLASGRLVTEQQLTDTNNQLATARADTSRIKAQLEDIKSSKGKGDSIPEVVASQTLINLKKQLAAASADRAKLAAQLLPRHPALIALQEQERQIRGDIDQEIKRILASVTHDYDRAKQREDSLAKAVEKLQADMNGSAVAQIQLRELERDLEGTRSLYEQSVGRSRETREQSRLNTSNVRVISSAMAAPNRAFPPRNVLLAPAGFLLGMFLGACLLLRRELLSVAAPKGSPEGSTTRVRSFDVNEFESRVSVRDTVETAAAKASSWRQSAMSSPPPLDADDVEIELRLPKAKPAHNKLTRAANKKIVTARKVQAVDALSRPGKPTAERESVPENPVLAVLASAKEIVANAPVGVNDNADTEAPRLSIDAADVPKPDIPVFDLRKVSELVQTASRYPAGMAIKRLADGVVSSRHGSFGRQIRELRRALTLPDAARENGPHRVAFVSASGVALSAVLLDAFAKSAAEEGKKVLVISSDEPQARHAEDDSYDVIVSAIDDEAPQTSFAGIHDVVRLYKSQASDLSDVDGAIAALASATPNLRGVIVIADSDTSSAAAVHAAS